MDDDTHAVALLSNYEVYSLLKELKETSVGQKSSNSQMPTLIYEMLQYFQTTPCVSQSPEAVKNLVGKLKPYNLTNSEMLTILNTRPTRPVEIQAIVEESEERLTETQIEEIIDIVEETLPRPPDQVKQEPRYDDSS